MLLEQFKQEFHHWLLQDGDHRLGDHMCDRLHPCSLASRQNHRLHWRFGLLKFWHIRPVLGGDGCWSLDWSRNLKAADR